MQASLYLMKQTLLPLHSTRPYDSVDLPEILVQFTGIQTLDVNIDSDPLIKAVAIGAIAFLTVWNCFGKFIEVRLESWTWFIRSQSHQMTSQWPFRDQKQACGSVKPVLSLCNGAVFVCFLCLCSHYYVTSLCIAIAQNVIAPLLFSLDESTVDGCLMNLLTESIYRGAFGSWPSEWHQHDEIRTPVASFSSRIDLFMGRSVCSTTQSVQTFCWKYSLKLWRELCCCSLGFHWLVSFFWIACLVMWDVVYLMVLEFNENQFFYVALSGMFNLGKKKKEKKMTWCCHRRQLWCCFIFELVYVYM